MEDQLPAKDYAFLTFLVGGLAHELRNPLSTISLNLQLLQEDWKEIDTANGRRSLKKLEVIRGETQRLQEILDNFLRFIRIDDLKLVEIDINSLLDEITGFVNNETKAAGIEFIKFYDYNLPRCKADVNFIKQALLNIIINARQAMERDGQILVRTANEGDRIRIEITDTGPGMEPEVLSKIFRPYFSTKDSGIGLGMPTTKRIIDEHEGTIQLQSEPGHGTNVIITLKPEGPHKKQND